MGSWDESMLGDYSKSVVNEMESLVGRRNPVFNLFYIMHLYPGLFSIV